MNYEELDRNVLLLGQQGKNGKEIASALGVNVRKVYRSAKRIKKMFGISPLDNKDMAKKAVAEEYCYGRNKEKMKLPHLSLCWRCANSTNSGCSWSREFKPVRGWTAEKKIQQVQTRANVKRPVISYRVFDCPQFTDDTKGRCL